MNKLNNVIVFFNDVNHSYTTNVSAKSTVESVTDYFLNTLFDVADYPAEKMEKCIGLMFIDENKHQDHFVGNCSFRNLKKYNLVDKYLLVTGKKPFSVSFLGCEKGAIGLPCTQSVAVMASNEESARAEVYEIGFSHCSGFKFKQLSEV